MRRFGIIAGFVVVVVAVSFFVVEKNKPVRTVQSGNMSSCIRSLACPDCNVILISADSFRSDHVGAYGYKRDTTPNFDMLAKKGALFSNYFSTSFLTPVSEMSVHTGMYPTANGLIDFDNIMPEQFLTLAQFMKNTGYHTSSLISSPEFVVGINLAGSKATKKSFSRGFDQYKPMRMSRGIPKRDELLKELGGFDGKRFFWWLAIGTMHWPYGGSMRWPYGWKAPNIYADNNYHGVFTGEKYKGKKLDWVNVFGNIYDNVIYPENVSLSKEDRQYLVDVYDNGVHYFDTFVGDLLGVLASQNLMDRTIIIIQSEHGEDLGEHKYYAHYDVYDTQIHTPLLIFSPKLKNARIVRNLASGVDIVPTVFELIGRSPPGQSQGRSLVQSICGKTPDIRNDEVFVERIPFWEEAIITNQMERYGFKTTAARHREVAMRTHTWKYILRSARTTEEKISWWQIISGKKIRFPDAELYDIVNDPLEQHNVVDQHPEEARYFRDKMEAWYSFLEKRSPRSIQRQQKLQDYF